MNHGENEYSHFQKYDRLKFNFFLFPGYICFACNFFIRYTLIKDRSLFFLGLNDYHYTFVVKKHRKYSLGGVRFIRRTVVLEFEFQVLKKVLNN